MSLRATTAASARGDRVAPAACRTGIANNIVLADQRDFIEIFAGRLTLPDTLLVKINAAEHGGDAGIHSAGEPGTATVQPMRPQQELPDEAREELRRSMVDETFVAERLQYVSTVLAVIIIIEDWLAIDSWLGGGKVSDTERRDVFGEAFSEFRAVSMVV